MESCPLAGQQEVHVTLALVGLFDSGYIEASSDFDEIVPRQRLDLAEAEALFPDLVRLERERNLLLESGNLERKNHPVAQTGGGQDRDVLLPVILEPLRRCTTDLDPVDGLWKGRAVDGQPLRLTKCVCA